MGLLSICLTHCPAKAGRNVKIILARTKTMMMNRSLTDAEMDRMELIFGATLPATKEPEVTETQKIAAAFVLGLAIAGMFLI